MPRIRPTNPLGVALTAFEVWRRLPPRHRKLVLKVARTHGPKVASALLRQGRSSLRSSARPGRKL